MTMDLPQLPLPPELQYSDDKLPILLLALCEEPVEVRACKKARIHPAALAFARKADPQLNSKIEWALQVGFSVVEERIYARGMGENKVPKLFAGKPITYIDQETGETMYVYEENQSDALLKRFAERVRPDLYGDQVQVKVDNRTTIFLPQAEMRSKFEEMLAAQAEKTRLLSDLSIEDQMRQLESGGDKAPIVDAEYEVVVEDDLEGLT